MCLTLRIVFGLPLRQTQGLMRTIAALAGVEMTVPDFSTPSRRGKGLTLPPARRTASRTPVHSTGLKVFGDGEWLENKHKINTKRKRWRKLHVGLDLVSGEIVCCDLTADDVGDSSALPDLLGQLDGPIDKFIADGAYDGAPPVTFWRHALARLSRSLSRLRGQRFKARNRQQTHRYATATSPKSRPKDGSENQGYVCTTGWPLLPGGTARQLHVTRAAGALSNEDSPHDIFRLSCLTWTRPESCSRLPISLKLCDTARAEF